MHSSEIAAKFDKGLWIGREMGSNEHLVSTSKGFVGARTVRLLASLIEEKDRLMAEHQWTPWRPNQSFVEEELERKTIPEDELGGGGSPNTRFLRGFQHAYGKTLGCTACESGAHGRAHSSACKARQAVYREQLEARNRQAAAEEEAALAAASAVPVRRVTFKTPGANVPRTTRDEEPAKERATKTALASAGDEPKSSSSSS